MPTSAHLTFFIQMFLKNYKKTDPVNVHFADDGVVQAIGVGDIVMAMTTRSGKKKCLLKGVWHIFKLSRNLFSVKRFIKDVAPIIFDNKCCAIQLK